MRVYSNDMKYHKNIIHMNSVQSTEVEVEVVIIAGV